MTEVRHASSEQKSIIAEAKSETESHLSENETESGSVGSQESDELEDSERLANNIQVFDEVRRKDTSFMAFMKTKLFEIYLVTQIMSLNPLKDLMSLQNAGQF